MSVAAGAPAEMSQRAKMLVMGATLLGLFVAAMDQTVVSTALPRIVSELGGFDRFSWVFTAYMLTSTVTAPVWGKLSDIWGRKPFLMLGVALFVATSVATGASQTMTQLIIFRGLQGIGAGMIMACAFTMIGDIFTPKERGKYQGLFAGVFGLASIVGPTLGGAVTDHLSWRWAFYLNIPVGLIALPVLWKVLPVIKHGRRGAIDYAGSLLLAAAVTPLLLAFVWAGQDYAWNSIQVVGLFTASFAMTVAFVLAEWKADDPIIPLHLFKNGTYNIASLTTFLTGMGIFGATVYVPLFVQGVIGASATNSGTVMAPMMAGLIVSSAITGNLVSRTGRYKIPSIIGTMIMTGGLYLLSTMGADTTRLTATAFMAVLGFGVGMVMPTMNVVAQNAMPMNLLGVVTSNLQFYRSIGGTVGVAIMGTIVTNQLRSKLPPLDERAQSLPEPMLERLRDPQALVNPEIRTLLQGAFSQIEDGAVILAGALEGLRLALADSLEWTFLVGVFLSGATLVALLFLKEAPLRRTFESPPPEGFVPDPEGVSTATAALPPPPAPPAPGEAPREKPSPVASPEAGTAGARALTLPALDWGLSRPDGGQEENGARTSAALASSPPLAGGAPAGEPASMSGDVIASAARNGAEAGLRLPPPPPPIPSNGRSAPAPEETAPRLVLPPPPPPIPAAGRPLAAVTARAPAARPALKQQDAPAGEAWRVVVAEFRDVRSPDLAAELVLALTRINSGCRVRSFSFEGTTVRAELLVAHPPPSEAQPPEDS